MAALIEKNSQIDVDIELLDPPDNRELCEQTTTTRKAYPRRIWRIVQRYGIHPTERDFMYGISEKTVIWQSPEWMSSTTHVFYV